MDGSAEAAEFMQCLADCLRSFLQMGTFGNLYLCLMYTKCQMHFPQVYSGMPKVCLALWPFVYMFPPINWGCNGFLAARKGERGVYGGGVKDLLLIFRSFR